MLPFESYRKQCRAFNFFNYAINNTNWYGWFLDNFWELFCWYILYSLVSVICWVLFCCIYLLFQFFSPLVINSFSPFPVSCVSPREALPVGVGGFREVRPSVSGCLSPAPGTLQVVPRNPVLCPQLCKALTASQTLSCCNHRWLSTWQCCTMELFLCSVVCLTP